MNAVTVKKGYTRVLPKGGIKEIGDVFYVKTQHILPDCPHKNKVPSVQWFRETGIEHIRSFLNS